MRKLHVVTDNDSSSPHVAVMGGTFDPVHHGHTEATTAVDEYFTEIGRPLDEIVFVPAGIPWQKASPMFPYRERFYLTELATWDYPRFRVSDAASPEHGLTYDIDTFQRLHEQLTEKYKSEVDIEWIMGTDTLRNIDTWKSWEEFVGSVSLAVIDRSSQSTSDVFQRFDERVAHAGVEPRCVTRIAVRTPDISGTVLRQKFETGRLHEAAKFLHPRVWAHFQQHGVKRPRDFHIPQLPPRLTSQQLFTPRTSSRDIGR